MARKVAPRFPGREKRSQSAAGPYPGRSRYSQTFEDFIKLCFATYYGEKPPWTCHFCGGDIVELGQGKWSLHRHHIDGNRGNNSRGNLVPSHQSCHNSHHAKKRQRNIKGLFVNGA